MEIAGVVGAAKRVLQRIPQSELESITMPVLRGKVAVEMGAEEGTLKAEEFKTALLATFQDFLLNGAKEDYSDADDLIEESPKKVVKKESSKKNKTDPTPKKTKPSDAEKPAKSKSESKKSTDSSSPSDSQIERLKSYIFKCGVRKVWKRELDGLSKKQCIDHLNSILSELGMSGRPTLEKCKEIRKRREFEAEMKEIDVSNIITEPRRRSSVSGGAMKRALVESSASEEDSESESEAEVSSESEAEVSSEVESSSQVSTETSESTESSESTSSNNLNWKSLGDPEDSE